MRLTLTIEDINILITLSQDEHLELSQKMEVQLQSNLTKDISKKQKSIQEATETRTKEAKKKIENAINLLRIENKSLTVYSIAKVSGCSYNTVKKHYKATK